MEDGRPQPSSCSSHFEGASRQRSPVFSAHDVRELADDVRELAHDLRELAHDVKELPSSRCESAADGGELADVVKMPFPRRSVKVDVVKKLADDVRVLAAVGCVLEARGWELAP